MSKHNLYRSIVIFYRYMWMYKVARLMPRNAVLKFYVRHTACYSVFTHAKKYDVRFYNPQFLWPWMRLFFKIVKLS